MLCMIFCVGSVALCENDSLRYRVVSVPFNESIQMVFRQYVGYMDVSWKRTLNGDTSAPIPLYSIFIQHRGVNRPGFFNRKYREYNIRIEDLRPDGSYRAFQRADSRSVRQEITEHLVRLSNLYEYPERDIVMASMGVVMFMYELTGEVPKVDFQVFENGAVR